MKIVSGKCIRSKREKVFDSKVNVLLAGWAKDWQDALIEMPENDFVRNVIEFMIKYMSFMKLNGESEDNLARIKYFFSIQNSESDGEKMKIVFKEGLYPDVFIYADKCQDVDIDDMYTIASFDSMVITREGNKRWTKKSADAFFKEVQDDIYFDNTKDEIFLDYEFKGKLLKITFTNTMLH